MTNVLVAPDLQRSYVVSADWIEVLALVRPEKFATDADILKPNDILEDRAAPLPEAAIDNSPVDPDILDVDAEPALDAIYDELAFRQQALNDAYPFKLEINRRRLKISLSGESEDPLIQQGRAIYISCLLMSAIRSGLINHKATAIKVDPDIGNLFQICATIAAAGYLHGDAYWFGHPRPDATPMMDAVKTLTSLIKQGNVALELPTGESCYAKDCGVDVVAWRDHHDGRPAKMIMYGQCASGMKWEGKPVGPKVQRLDNFYTLTPSKHWLPALLTPFPLYMDKENAHGLVNEDKRQGFYRVIESEMGIIIDRVRIVHWCIEGLRDQRPSMRVAVEKLGELFEWSSIAQEAAQVVA